jgi:hypothetical protein
VATVVLVVEVVVVLLGGGASPASESVSSPLTVVVVVGPPGASPGSVSVSSCATVVVVVLAEAGTAAAMDSPTIPARLRIKASDAANVPKRFPMPMRASLFLAYTYALRPEPSPPQ